MDIIGRVLGNYADLVTTAHGGYSSAERLRLLVQTGIDIVLPEDQTYDDYISVIQINGNFLVDKIDHKDVAECLSYLAGYSTGTCNAFASIPTAPDFSGYFGLQKK